MKSYEEKAKKLASVELTIKNLEKIAFDKYMDADYVRVLDDEIGAMLPALSNIEPELPAPLLDNLARNYSIPDILHSFAGAAIPMKPEEFTRIIIVNKGLPLSGFNDILRGVLQAEEGSKALGKFDQRIAEKLVPFIHKRSALTQAVLERLDKIFSDIKDFESLTKQAATIYKPNPVYDSLDISPSMNFGYVRRVPEFQNLDHGLSNDSVLVNYSGNLSTMPVALSPQALQQEIQSPALTNRERNNLLAMGSMMGKDYSAFKNPEIIRSVLREPSILSTLALLVNSFRGKPANPMPITGRNVVNNVSLQHLINAYNPIPHIIGPNYYKY